MTKRSRFIVALALAGSAALAGCAAPAAPPPPRDSADARVTLTPDTPLIAQAPVLVRGFSGLEVSVRLINPLSADVATLATVDWVDAQDRPIETVMSRPRRLTVPRFGDAVLQGVAPTPDAVTFRIRIEPDPTAAF